MASKRLKANKKATRGKEKAWKKGQSSSYNPKFNKFRQSVKKQASFGYQASNSHLTESALAKHNRIDVDDNDQVSEDINFDGLSIGGESFVSTFSQCTNPSFNRLLRCWESKSSLHKEMLAVLAAVTDVIKLKGGKETETEYFAALMTTLDVVENDEAVTAVVTLLYMVIKRLPVPVLKFNFSTACSALKKLLVKYGSSDYNALLRNLLGCLYHFMAAQSGNQWTNTTGEMFSILLEFTVYQKPKVRKSAHDAVSSLLKSFNKNTSEGSIVHPAAISTSQFCIQKLENSSGSSQTALHVLNLLQDTVAFFPKAKLKFCCETILKTMTLSNTIVILNCLKVLQGLFVMKPKPENLPTELNVKIIKALYDYQPSMNDSLPFINWLLVMESAFLNLHRLHPSICITHLPNFFKVLVSCWLSEKDEIQTALAFTLTNVLHGCISPTSSEFQQFMLDDPVNNPMHKIFHCVEAGLGYQYHKAWRHILTVIGSFFDVMGKHSYTVMIKCLQSLADLRDSVKFPYIADLDKAFGMAIRRMGPEVVLKAVPFQLNDKLDFPRSWLLPLMRDNIRETELAFFIRYFLPLASQLKQKVIECENEKKVMQSKTYEILCSQIWFLLPGFCTSPTDLKESFKNIARILGVTLTDNPDLRMVVLSSLRVLITKNIEKEENRVEISRFAKNYLPILFNLYTTESKNKGEEGIRLAVFDTVKTYLKIADKDICEHMFLKAMEKLAECDAFTKHSLLDLNKATLPYVNEELVKNLYVFCKPLLQDSNHTIQKKSYGVLNELCCSKTESCRVFVQNNLDDLKSLLLTSLSSSAPSSKGLRLNCLCHIINQLTEENKEFISAVVPEATLCTKEMATKARNAAYKLLTEIGLALKRWHPTDVKGALRSYMQMLLAGFAGSPHLMSATILAIGHVIYEFKGDLDSDIIHLLIENVCLLLMSNSREVITSALSFIKVLFSTVSTVDLAQHVEYLVKSIASISEDNQRHFRFKAKELFTRLIRKFGFEMVSKLAPTQFQKQLMNIRKLEARKAKKNSAEHEEDEFDLESKKKSDLIDDILEDTDDESEMEITPSRSKQKQKSVKRRKQTDSAWIEEGVENDIVDFMDPGVNKKILASKPGTVTVKAKPMRGFEMSEDGRLIITDDKKENSKKMDGVKEDAANTGKKRKHEDVSDEDNDDPSSYKPILKGIHRILNKEKAAPGAQFKAKKAAGDVKKGKFNPFAHIPVDRRLLNKRKQKKLQSQFKGLVHAAKSGAKKGLKARAKKSRKRTL